MSRRIWIGLPRHGISRFLERKGNRVLGVDLKVEALDAGQSLIVEPGVGMDAEAVVKNFGADNRLNICPPKMFAP
jgi:hypothetical protein